MVYNDTKYLLAWVWKQASYRLHTERSHYVALVAMLGWVKPGWHFCVLHVPEVCRETVLVNTINRFPNFSSTENKTTQP